MIKLYGVQIYYFLSRNAKFCAVKWQEHNERNYFHATSTIPSAQTVSIISEKVFILSEIIFIFSERVFTVI